MIFPIGDTQVIDGHKPYVSYSLIVLNTIIFIIQYITPGNLICEFSAVPFEILQGNQSYTMISSMFLHGSWLHLIGNMVFLWVFADNIEAKIGSLKFAIFYIIGGIIANFAHIYFSTYSTDLSQIQCLPCSMLVPCDDETIQIATAAIPTLGASGAIAAVLGAYLVMFPKSKIKILVMFLFRSFYLPAIAFLGIWFFQQLFYGIGSLSSTFQGDDSVAWWTHIGGFVFGLAAGFYFKTTSMANT
ncbi:MAG: rhomboid family intramembrane serine protease [Chitinophagales bacterium]|nr:rhomboid family intramembrane serine protease [Chitinophagales bacterium]